MPELPEVQTIVNDLNKKIAGYTITDFWSDWPKAIKNKTISEFKKELIGSKILKAHRIGKNMFIDISAGKTLYIHLKMTGHLLVKPQDKKELSTKGKQYLNDKVNQYIHHIWYLKKGTKNAKLEFSDLRKFAKIVLLDTKNIASYPDMKLVGIDAMDPKFTFGKFQELAQQKGKLSIGCLLMEQRLIAGIGNIYRSEILFEAGISPFRIVADLSDEELRRIYKMIGLVLKKAIRFRGTSDSDYRDTDGAPGGFQKILKVYNRERQRCKRKGCKGTIIRQALAQRSAFYCDQCQR